MNGAHGQIVQQHVVKESKQEPEHVRMMLQTLASPSLSKKFASCLQLIGGPGQAVPQLVVMASKQEQDHVLTIKAAPAMSQKPTKKLASFKNAVMTLGQHGLHGTHVRIMGLFHLNDNDRDVNSSKYQRVHKRVNRLKLNLKRRIVKIQ